MHSHIDEVTNSIQMDTRILLRMAVISGITPTAEMALDLDPKIINQVCDWNKKRPLHVAAACGNAEAIQLLLDRGASPHYVTMDKKTALQIAQENGAKDCVAVLERYMEAKAKAIG